MQLRQIRSCAARSAERCGQGSTWRRNDSKLPATRRSGASGKSARADSRIAGVLRSKARSRVREFLASAAQDSRRWPQADSLRLRVNADPCRQRAVSLRRAAVESSVSQIPQSTPPAGSSQCNRSQSRRLAGQSAAGCGPYGHRAGPPRANGVHASQSTAKPGQPSRPGTSAVAGEAGHAPDTDRHRRTIRSTALQAVGDGWKMVAYLLPTLVFYACLPQPSAAVPAEERQAARQSSRRQPPQSPQSDGPAGGAGCARALLAQAHLKRPRSAGRHVSACSSLVHGRRRNSSSGPGARPHAAAPAERPAAELRFLTEFAEQEGDSQTDDFARCYRPRPRIWTGWT